jgi:ribonuclease P protein component
VVVSGWLSEALSRGKRTRLTDSRDFERVYQQGAAYRGRLFSVHAFPNEFGTPRLGLSVSRRVGTAVTRNTVRRRLKEVFYSALPEIPSKLDLVVSARPAAAAATVRELSEEFVRSLRKLSESCEVREAGPR